MARPAFAILGARLICVLLTGLTVSKGESVIAPSASWNRPGNGKFASGFTYAAEFQQLYPADTFRAPVAISSVAFRPSKQEFGSPSFNVFIPSLSVSLTTYRSASPIHYRYSENAGPDDALVFQGPVHWVGVDNAFGAPNPFMMQIEFAEPFVYDPANGPLLLGVSSSGPAGESRMPEILVHDDPALGVFGVYFNGLSHVGPSTLITELQFEIIPEPSTTALLLTAAGLLAVTRIRRSRMAS